MPTPIEKFSRAMEEHADDFEIQLRQDDIRRLSDYYALLLKWNPRQHLVAPCSPEEFATRHVLESLTLLRHLPLNARIIDVGSGAGLPIIPCLIMREDLRATLIESSQKKTVFLHEALRGLTNPEPARLIGARFEEVSPPNAEFVTCRALNRFQQLLAVLIDWAPPMSTLLLFAGNELRKQIESLLPSAEAERTPQSDQRFLITARRAHIRKQNPA
jgi:16S rRNA (guanine527-N7)-methyltransferase